MIVKYKLENSFGPIGSIAGKILFLVCIIGNLFYSISIISILFLIIGAFMGFSKTDIFIDTENHKIRFSSTFFGFIKTGKWIDIDDDMEIGIRKSTEKWQVIGMSNKSITMKGTPYKIVLYKSQNIPLLTLKYASTIEEAEKELERFGKLLGME